MAHLATVTAWPPELRAAVIVGFLGGFTTYSSFNQETLALLSNGATMAMTAKWQGRSLLSEGTMKVPNGDTTTIQEQWSMSADGRVLTVQVTTTAAAKAESALAYTKVANLGPGERGSGEDGRGIVRDSKRRLCPPEFEHDLHRPFIQLDGVAIDV